MGSGPLPNVFPYIGRNDIRIDMYWGLPYSLDSGTFNGFFGKTGVRGVDIEPIFSCGNIFSHIASQ